MSTRSAESRDNSPDGENERRTSKKRKVLSCYACRNRKMKCDRIYPVCGRCQKTGRADQCTYDPRLLEDLNLHGNGEAHVDGGPDVVRPEYAINGNAPSAADPSDSLRWKVRVQERRLDALEKRLRSADDANTTPTQYSAHGTFDDEPTYKEDMVFRGKGFKTRFYGSTSSYSLIAQFRELQTFTRESIMRDNSMMRIRTDFKTFRSRRKTYTKEKGLKTQGVDAEILAALPDRAVVDDAATLYFEQFENTYRILHEPTFWKDYAAFWEERAEPPSVSFAAILVLLIAVTKCLFADQETAFIGDSSVERDTASTLIDTCDAWLSRHSRKHLTISFFQMQCLSLLAKRVNCVKMKQEWVHSGDVMRLSIAAGLHRNPNLLGSGKMSEYEKEMRGRLWSTVSELELQASIDCGLQSSLCSLHTDAQIPINLPDDAFTTESPQLPAGRPIEYFTANSYSIWSAKSLSLRVHLMQLLNNPMTDLQYSDVLHYDKQITSMLSMLPSWDEPRSAMPRALLDLQLRQFLLLLHRPYAMLAGTNPRFAYSFTSCVKSASSIISTHDALLNKGHFATNHSRNDTLRAAMTLAQIVYNNSDFSHVKKNAAIAGSHVSVGTGSNNRETDKSNGIDQHCANATPPPPLAIPQLPEADFMTRMLCISSIELMEQARSIFEHKVMRLGTGYMECWLLCAAIGLMPATPPTPTTTSSSINTAPDDIDSRARSATNRLTSLCFRVLAMQRDPGNDFASSLRNTFVSSSSPDGRSHTSTNGYPSGSIATPLQPDVDLTLQPFIPGTTGMIRALDEGAKSGFTTQGPWSGLQDMQVDATGWDFPDIWAFDLGGDF